MDDHKSRKPGPRGAKASQPSGPSAGSATRPDEGAPVDPVHEPPPASRWEDEGGAVVEPAVTLPSDPDYKDRWLRAEAELQNFRRRATREWEEGRRNAEESVLLEMVGALDDLERALEAARGSGADQEWVKGVALVAQRLRDYLARQGVSIVDPLGEPFDPAFHEALLETDAPPGTPPGIVMQVVQKGYRRGDRALRPARVVVARAPAGSAA